MAVTSNCTFRYDGSYQGFLCCVAECFRDGRLPAAIQRLDEPQATLYPIKAVASDETLAGRVEQSIREKISDQACRATRRVFLSCMEEKELHMIRFLLLGYKYGARVTAMSANEDVHQIRQALLYLRNEAHAMEEFLRFSDLGSFLAAEISPNNNVLPLIAGHFCDRLPSENFMIFDKVHGLGFLSQPGGRQGFFYADSVELPPPSEEEEEYRALWKEFYRSVAVEGRKNPKLRMTNVHKRFWKNMIELRDEL